MEATVYDYISKLMKTFPFLKVQIYLLIKGLLAFKKKKKKKSEAMTLELLQFPQAALLSMETAWKRTYLLREITS